MASSGDFGVVIDGLAEARKALKQASPEIARELNKSLRNDSKVVVADARTRASWSKQIPGAITTSVTAKGAGVRIKRGTSRIAVLNEFGPWRHPLFGDRERWYPQVARPSVKPAIAAHRREMLESATAAVRTALTKVGLGG